MEVDEFLSSQPLQHKHKKADIPNVFGGYPKTSALTFIEGPKCP
jgi:hypothetical protein